MNTKNVDVVVVRMDKLGDLVLTLAVDEHPVLKGSDVHWWVSRGTGFIAGQASPPRAFTEFSRRFTPVQFYRAFRWLKINRPRTAVLLHNPWWVSAAVWLAGVPERVGRKSQWHSYLFLNVGVRQKRSLADRHESDYNFDLVEAGYHRIGYRHTGNLQTFKKKFLRLVPPHPRATLLARHLKAREYRVVHPGMAGSAMNWPPAKYIELVEALTLEGLVVITGTPADRKYLTELTSLKDHYNVRWLVGELSAAELLDVLAEARGVVAPSTGVLHLSASLGTPSVGIYSPRRVEHPRRWAPKGDRARYLVPPVQDAELFAPDVMEQVHVEDVLKTLRQLEA